METDMTMLAGATVIGGILGIYSTLRLIYYIFYMIANWKIFSKAGEPGWKSLIPFYNVYTEYKLMWKPQLAWIYIVLGVLADIFLKNTGTSALMFLGGLICTIAYLVIDFKEKQHVSKAFGHGFGFGVGLFLLQPIFSMILGFEFSKNNSYRCFRSKIKALSLFVRSYFNYRI